MHPKVLGLIPCNNQIVLLHEHSSRSSEQSTPYLTSDTIRQSPEIIGTLIATTWWCVRLHPTLPTLPALRSHSRLPLS